MSNDHVTAFDTVKAVAEYFGVPLSNDLVSVIDLEEVGTVTHVVKRFGLYCVTCVIEEDNNTGYAARLYFTKPGQYGRYSSGVSVPSKGWLLCFHPDVLQGTLLANRMSDYYFFGELHSMPMYLDAEELHLVDSCMRSIRTEQYHKIDRYTNRIIVSGIAVLLTQCLRFYDRRDHDRVVRNNDIMRRVDMLLNDHFSSPKNHKMLPTVAWCAEKLSISANYLGDLMRKYGNVSAQEHIHRRIVEEIKIYLEHENCSIGHIAYVLGFKHPHHLSRLFRKTEGCTPIEYRQRFHNRDIEE